MAHEFSTSYVKDALSIFRQYKRWADRAVEQVADENLYTTLDPESNSIAIIMKHLAGNMRSRWTDFLSSDGEKPNRNRDSEFEAPPATRAGLLAMWEEAWGVLFAALEPLSDVDLTRTILIRTEPHSVMQAINRNITHCAQHIGQIILLAKHYSGAHWKTLTVPRGKSAEFMADVAAGRKSQR
jgi:uncharacterized protein DUF1572